MKEEKCIFIHIFTEMWTFLLQDSFFHPQEKDSHLPADLLGVCYDISSQRSMRSLSLLLSFLLSPSLSSVSLLSLSVSQSLSFCLSVSLILITWIRFRTDFSFLQRAIPHSSLNSMAPPKHG